MRSKDWSTTPVGPVELWPESLKISVAVCLRSKFPIVIWWGREHLTQFYNDAYVSFLGNTKHPGALAQSARDCWKELWHIIDPMLEGVFETGEATWSEDLLFVIDRALPREEGYFTFSYSGIPQCEQIGGIFCACVETTDRVIGERQLALLRGLAAEAAEAHDWQQACRGSAEALETNRFDLPFTLLYLVEGEGKISLAAKSGSWGKVTTIPESLDLGEDLVWPFTQVLRTNTSCVISDLQRLLPEVPLGPWPHPATQAVALPISASGQSGKSGVLIVGLNPYRPLDDKYRRFLTLVAAQISANIADAYSHEQERKRAEALAEIDRAKTTFFSNVSHEFRTPLTLVLGPTEEALNTPGGGLRGAELEVVYRNQLRLLKLVNTLLDFSRIEAGRIGAIYQPTDIATLTADLASTFRSAMQRAGLEFEVDCPPIPELIFVDRDMWEKIVLNLISNAFKFTFEGKVSVSIRENAGQVELRVRDTGTGIPEDELRHLFERFHRVANAKGRSFEGTGIGLALVQELAKLHGGSVTVESREGEGSSFVVTIPKGKDHIAQDRIAAARTTGTSSVRANSYVEEALRWLPSDADEFAGNLFEIRPDPTAYTISALAEDGFVDHSTPAEVIVLADDNSDMRSYIKRILRDQYLVHAFSDGLDALEAAQQLNADLILTDVMMPRLDGFGLLKALRSNPMTRFKPVILLSARAGEESRLEGLAAGADDYLVKPFTARELLARVGAHLKMARIRIQAAETERRLRAEADLERNRLRELFSRAPAAMALLSGPDHRFTFVNPAYLQMSGRTRDELMGRTVREVFPELHDQGHFELLDRVYQTKLPFVAGEGLVTVHRNGRSDSFYMDFNYHPLTNLEGEVEGILFQGVDVTVKVLARTQLEERVRKRTAKLAQARKSLRTLNRRLLETQDEERKRLARELHDGAGQWVAALKWKLTTLQDDLARKNLDLATQASESLHMADELLNELRTLSQLLHPPSLDENGLSPALRSYVDGIAERSGLAIDLEIDPEIGRLSREVETAVYRIVQESLTNVHRHARTKTARVRLTCDSEVVCVEIRDQGKGMANLTSADTANSKAGVGLRGMQERVQQLDGKFEFQSGKDGTIVRATLPIKVRAA